MRRPTEVLIEEQSMGTLVELTSAFEGIASMRISQIRGQVLQSTKFFSELWGIYSQLRVDTSFHFGREDNSNVQVIDRDLYIIITAEGGFSGDIDQKVVELMLQTYDPDKQDIVVIGHHGATQLYQLGVAYKKYFKMPSQDRNINVEPISKLVQQYRSTVMFYQQYVSLTDQEVKSIELSSAVRERAQARDLSDGTINENTYIFEPSAFAVAAHLERSMMQIAISQLLLESKLAQYASRFRAMSASHERSDELKGSLHLEYSRSKRAVKDERLKEIVNGLKKGAKARAVVSGAAGGGL